MVTSNDIYYLDIVCNIKENNVKLSKSKDALYTSLAANCFVILIVGTQLFIRSVVKKDPTTQNHHLIGFMMIGFAGLIFLLIFAILALCKYSDVPLEERSAHPCIRIITFFLLIPSSCFLTYMAIGFIYNIIKYGL